MQLPTNKTGLSKADQLIADQCQRSGSTGLCSVGIAQAGFAESETADEYLFWFPLGVPVGSSVAVASSRLSQKLDEESEWFDALRTLVVHVSKAAEFLITASGTTAHPFVRRLAELFKIPLLDFEPFPKLPSPGWFDDQIKSAENATGQGGRNFKAFFKPLERVENPRRKSNIDELLIGLANTAVLLSVRKNGNIHKSAQRRIARKTTPGTRLLINRKLTPEWVESDLLQRGATAWWLYGPERTDAQTSSQGQTSLHHAGKPNAIILTLDEIKTENYLAHWTRRRVGPWPDQTQPEYLDDLIFLTSRREHNEVSALCRILALGRIIGSHDLTRDPRDVVCFSDLPLDEILKRRVFRPHLSRWDFEPYGIAIDRELLMQLGARPVFYGEESDWGQLSEIDQAFFQLNQSQSSDIDWSEEQEWRIVGDLRLDNIPVDQAVVFVKSESDAQMVAALSRWPIVILADSH